MFQNVYFLTELFNLQDFFHAVTVYKLSLFMSSLLEYQYVNLELTLHFVLK